MRIAPSRLRKRSDLLVTFRHCFGRHGNIPVACRCRRCLGVLVLLPPLIWMCATLTWQHAARFSSPHPLVSPDASSSSISLLLRRTKKLEKQQQPESNSSSNVLHHTLLTLPHISAEFVWKQLVEEGSHQMRHNNQNDHTIGVAMEVGMHTAKQCLLAAHAGFEVHCVEPSPVSFHRVQAAFNASIIAANQQDNPSTESLPFKIRPDRVHLYQAAAGRSSDAHVDFVGRGGTGDHVGNIDVWNMRAGPPIDKALAAKQGLVQTVRTVALDDIIANNLGKGTDRAFVLKIDTQGYEPAVFSGLSHSIAQHKISFVLFEYWPAGMDLMMQQQQAAAAAANEPCMAATTLLHDLLQAGYTLYALPVQSHPAAPEAAKRVIQDVRRMPLDSVSAHCHYFYHVAKEFPSDTYKMGYWSDVLAVAPNVTLPVLPPVTELVKLLLQ